MGGSESRREEQSSGYLSELVSFFVKWNNNLRLQPQAIVNYASETMDIKVYIWRTL